MLQTPGLSLASWPEPIRESASHSSGVEEAVVKVKMENNWKKMLGRERKETDKQTNRQTDPATVASAFGRPENVIPTLNGVRKVKTSP